jgi:hypothetical protein
MSPVKTICNTNSQKSNQVFQEFCMIKTVISLTIAESHAKSSKLNQLSESLLLDKTNITNGEHRKEDSLQVLLLTFYEISCSDLSRSYMIGGFNTHLTGK